MPNGAIGYGLALKVGSGTLVDVIDVQGAGFQVDSVDVTTNSSTNGVRGFIPGLQKNEELKWTGLYTTGTYSTLVAMARTVETFTLTLNDTHVFSGSGFISNLSGKYPLGDKEVIDITLTPPNLANLDVCSDNGSSLDNFVNTILDTTCATAVTAGAAPFTGCYKPETAFTSLNGTIDVTLQVGPLPPVAAVAFSPDGKLLASGIYGRVTVWDLETAMPVKFLTNVLGAVNALKFSPSRTL